MHFESSHAGTHDANITSKLSVYLPKVRDAVFSKEMEELEKYAKPN